MKILVSIVLLIIPAQLAAATFSVSAMASGGYGSTNIVEPFEPLIEGPSLSAGEAIVITASGEIGTGVGTTSTPDGNPFTFSGESRSPLQEAGAASFPTDQNAVGLTGYFVALSELPVAAFDSERGGDLPASGLFFVGSRLQFTALEDGTLFFGINDPRASNNTGAFTVNISAVPVPTSIVMLATGFLLLGFRHRSIQAR